MRILLKLVCIVFMSILVVGCSSASPVSVPANTATRTYRPTVTLTPFPTITLTPAITWTPLPTLSEQEAQERVMQLLEANGGCELPCWWGVVPGSTKFSDASYQFDEFLIKPEEIFGLTILQSVPGTFKINNVEGYTYYFPEIGTFDAAYGAVNLISEDDLVIAMILSGYQRISSKYSILDVINNYGMPETIWVYTLRDSYGEGVLPFTITLDYSNQGFLIYYEGNGQPIYEEGVIRLCYQDKSIPPKMILWSTASNNPVLSNSLDYIYSIWSDMKSLDVATNMTVEEFLGLIRNSNSSDQRFCINTPTNIWDY